MDSILWDENRKRKNIDECLFESVLKLTEYHDYIPEGVIIVTAGGLKGYSGGNLSVPKLNFGSS